MVLKMELDFEELMIIQEQAHEFALSIFNDIRDYFLDLEYFIDKLLKISANVIASTDGVFITADDIFNYNLCKYHAC